MASLATSAPPAGRHPAARSAAAVLLTSVLAAPALIAGGLVPTSQPPLDPSVSAQLVISEVGPGPAPTTANGSDRV